ncbi:uncharacterized protein BX663DRAFT_505457 [Cokeromyces recurvatus]|uniref:uncharacterized protein n=1 Tax=Cokeromyces recurvatus TaxID=90255 RepID=UPI00221EB649|nr:uncharacterized protein BX663DRAFT_505457 [Cokeromyces recurvatus]KAI7903849.1 hypothetical protein BX663DRAFT_505457 [Cokeromyces recurvatus]
METSSIETIVCLVPNKEQNEGTIPTTSNYPLKQQFMASPVHDRFQLFLNGKDKEFSWNVKECITPQLNEASIQEQKRLIQLVLKGYNATCLLISAGDTNSLYQQRKADTERILNLLNEAISKNTNTILIEYSYFGITDDYIYDFRKEREISNSAFFEKRQDAFMKRVEKIPTIWNKLKRGSKLPFILNIKLTNTTKSIQSRLQIVDMLHPPLPNDTFYHSYSSLVGLINKINSSESVHLNSDFYVLTDVLSKNMCGHDALTVFAYFNEYVVDKYISDIVSCLDLSASLNKIKVCLLPNTSVYQTIEYKKIKVKCDTLETAVTELTKEKKDMEERLKIKEDQAQYLECTYRELQQRTSPIIQQLKQNLAYEQTASSLQQFKIQELELSLKREAEKRQSFMNNDMIALKSQLVATKRSYEESQTKVTKLQRELDDRQLQIYRLEQEKLTQVQLRQQEQQQLMMLNSDAHRFERDIKQNYKAKYEEKFNQMYSEFQRKIKQVERKYEKEISRLKQVFEEDINLVRETERANYNPEVVDKLRQNLKDLHLKNIDLRNANAELKFKLKQSVENSNNMSDNSRSEKTIERRVNTEHEGGIESLKRPKHNNEKELITEEGDGSKDEEIEQDDTIELAKRVTMKSSNKKAEEQDKSDNDENENENDSVNKDEVVDLTG